MKHYLTLGLMAAYALTGCSSTSGVNTVNLKTENVRLEDGYVNSKTLSFGDVFIWNLETDEVLEYYHIDADQIASATVIQGPTIDEKSSTVSTQNNFDMGIGTNGLTEQVKLDINREVAGSTDVSLQNFAPQRWLDSTYVLNSPELRSWRESIQSDINDTNATDYSDPKYRFVFVSKVTNADELAIGREASGGAGVDAGLIQVGDLKVKATYDNKSNVRIKAKQAPLTISPTVYTFKVSGDSYRFYRDAREFPIQKVKWLN
jgi:hypothetical protein